MQPARFRADLLGDRGGEGDDIVADFRLNLLNAGDVDGAAIADGFGGLGRNDAEFRERFGGGGLDLEPHAVFILFRPDAAHLGASVAVDHGWFLFGAELEDSGELLTLATKICRRSPDSRIWGSRILLSRAFSRPGHPVISLRRGVWTFLRGGSLLRGGRAVPIFRR